MRISKIKTNKKLIHILSVIFVILFALLSGANVFAAESNTKTSTQSVSSMVKNISVKGGTFTNKFKAGNYNYSVYLKSYVESLYVSVELNNKRFEYTVSGDVLLDKTKDNVVIINVTDPKGEYNNEKYTLSIFFDTIGLTYLNTENGLFSPQFDNFHTTYYVILENSIDSFDDVGVKWKTANKDAVVEVVCDGELNKDGTLPEGERTTYKLKVYEADGTTSKTYMLKLYRKSSTVMPLDENALLANIKINGGSVEMPVFRQKQSVYDIKVPKAITELDIQAYPEDKSNIVEVIGNTAMKENEPIYITIVVKSDKYDATSYYTLRCQYESVIYTDKYTLLQLIAYVGIALFAGLLIGFVFAMILKQKKKINLSDHYADELQEGDEVTVEQAEISNEEKRL